MIELIEKLMAADHIWQSDKAYIEATEAFKIIRQHQAEQCIQTPPDCINSQGDVNKPGDQGCEISDVEKAALDVVIEYDRISEYDPDPLARNLATTRGTGAAVCYWAVQKALRETKPVSSGDAGSEDARAFLSSRNNALSMPAGSNPRTSRAPTEESSNHNGLGRAKGSEMANSAPPTDQPDELINDERTLQAELKALASVNRSSTDELINAMMPTISHYLGKARTDGAWASRIAECEFAQSDQEAYEAAFSHAKLNGINVDLGDVEAIVDAFLRARVRESTQPDSYCDCPCHAEGLTCHHCCDGGPRPMREYVNADDRNEATRIIADFFVSKLASYESPHNATIYAEWALTSLLQRFDIRRRS